MTEELVTTVEQEAKGQPEEAPGGVGRELSAEESLRERDWRIATLQEALSQLRGSLAQRDAQLQELEAELASAQKALKEQGDQALTLREELSAALGRYRTTLLEGAPEVPQELVQGESVQALEESFARARELVERVRRGVEAKLARERVPPGVPPRRPADISGLSPKDKIALGLQRLQS